MKRVIQTISLFTFFFLFSFIPNLTAQSTGTLQTDGETYRYGYAGGNEKYRDFTIPADHDPDTDFNQITFALRGGDGGRRRIQWICTEPGGKGARVDASFAIGYGEGELKPGGTIRIVVGQQGGSLKSGGLAGAGGGGGSAVLYSDPDLDGNACKEGGKNIPSIEWDTTCWILLAVAGGGGGAYAPGGCAQASSGKPGNGGTNGTDGKGITAGAGGHNGNGGSEGDNQGGAGGGYRPKFEISVASGENGGLNGGPGGESDPVLLVRGGYGYGGGGSGLHTWLVVRGGGGGGFSGGGYGSQYEGGGGGGSFANSYATSFDKRDGNGTDRTPNNGYVSYFLNFNNDLVDAPNAVCQDTTVYIIGEEQTINAAEIAYNSTDPNDRPLTYCFDFGDACSPNIGFDCNDLGDEEVYTVRVDNGFTSSTCTVNLEIQQGTPGMLECPGAQTIRITDCDGVLNDGQTNPGMGQLFIAPFEFPTCEYTLEYYIQRPDGSIDTDHLSDNAVEGIQSDTFDLGTSLVVYTVGYEDEDGVERSQTCVISITVEGQENFSINCPNNISIDIPNGDIDPESPCSFLVEHGFGPDAYDLTPNSGGCGDLSYAITHPDVINPTVVSGTGELTGYDFPVGISTVEYTLERLPGELYTCSFTVEIDQSTQPPTISNCPEGDVYITIFDGISDEEILEQISFDVSDDCGIASIELENLNLSCAELEDRQDNVRIRVTDTDGNTDFCNIDVRTEQELQIRCPEDIVVPVEVGFCFAAIAEESLAPIEQPVCPFNFTYNIVDLNNNNMSIASGAGNIPQQVLSAGQYRANYSWQVGNNLGVCSFIIQVVDEEAPEIVCQDATVNLSELPANPADLLFVSATDDCSTTFTASVNASFDCDNLGFNTVIVTVADESGNEAVCGAVLNIIDDELPVITTCPEDRTITLDANCEATLPDLTGEIVGMSNCGTATPFQFPEAGMSLSAGDGVIEVSVNLVEESGQEAAVPCTVQITVPDDAPPTAVCQDITISLDGDSYTISTSDIDNESSDDCGTPSLSLDRTSFDCADVGTRTVTLTVTDDADNSATCTATVTVQDNIAPTATCQDVTLQLNAAGNTTLSPAMIDNGSSDACGLQPLSVSPTSFGCNEVGGNTATLTVTDQNGNSSTCTATVTVQDNVAPTAFCQDVTIQLNATGIGATSPNEVDNGSSDACPYGPVPGGIQSMILDQESFNCSDAGPNTLTLTVTDQNGNSNTCTATATVVDNIAPTAVCQPATVQLDGLGNGSLPAVSVNGGSSDACGVESLSIDAEAFDCNGPTTVTLTVTDFNGNSSTCTAAVTIEDVTSPIANCQSVTVQLDGSGIGVLSAEEVDNSSTDACGVTSRSLDQSTFSCAEVGSNNTVTLTVSDAAGNSSTCSTTVTVEDDVAPLAQCQPVTVQLNAAGTGSLMPEVVDKASTDACGVSNVELDITNFICNEVGPGNTVHLTVTDNNNNTSSCSATVTIEDNVAPQAVCQNYTLTLESDGTGTVPATQIDAASSDACGIASIALDLDYFDCTATGKNMVTLTVTDVNGNTATCTAEVLVEDNVPPIPVCNHPVITFNGQEVINLTVEDLWNEAASTDNCDEVFYLGASVNEIGCEQVGSIIPVTVSVEDASGNSATCLASVTVQGLSCDWTSETMNCSEEATAGFDPNNGSFALEGEGCYDPNYYSNSDAQSMIQQELCGDGEIIAQVSGIDGDAWAGVFMRESNDPGAKTLQLAVNNSGLAQRKLRTTTGGLAFNHLFQNQGKFWVRLTRSGNQFGAFLSLDGINWDVVLMTNIPMTNCIQTGLFVSNTITGSPATAWFDHVQIKPPAGSSLQSPITNEQHPTSQYANIPMTNTQPPTSQYANTPKTQHPNTPLQRDISIYPNPTGGEVHVVLSDFMEQPLEIAVYNQQGQRVKRRELPPSHSQTERIRLYDLKNGLYLIQVRSETHSISKKISLIR